MLWVGRAGPVKAVCFQASLCVSRSTHNTTRCFPLSSDAVKKIRWPQIVGDDWPCPGKSTDQAIEVFDHWLGRSLSVECPSPRGPRQPGHVGTAADTVAEHNAATTIAVPNGLATGTPQVQNARIDNSPYTPCPFLMSQNTKSPAGTKIRHRQLRLIRENVSLVGEHHESFRPHDTGTTSRVDHLLAACCPVDGLVQSARMAAWPDPGDFYAGS